MSYIKKWSYIHKIYNESRRSSILWKIYSFSKIRENYHYWLILSLYFGISISSAILVIKYNVFFILFVLIVVGTAVLSRYLIERLLSRDLKEYYDTNGINEFPLLQRSRYLSYSLFKEKLVKDNVISANDIELIIKWDGIDNEKIDRNVFFKSKWFIIIISALFGFIGQYFLGLKLSIKEIIILSYIILIGIWLAYMIFDFSTISKERRLNIYRFLKWFQLEHGNT